MVTLEIFEAILRGYPGVCGFHRCCAGYCAAGDMGYPGLCGQAGPCLWLLKGTSLVMRAVGAFGGVWLFTSQAPDGIFQLAYSGFCVVQRGDVLTGIGVIPAQLTVFPTEVQVEDLAVSLQAAVGALFDGDGLVLAVDQSVAGEAGAVELSRLVEAPVFGYV